MKTHVLMALSRRDASPPAGYVMHIKEARSWLDENGLSGDLCDHLPIYAMSIKPGRIKGWAYGAELWIVPLTKQQYLEAKCNGYSPLLPNVELHAGLEI